MYPTGSPFPTVSNVNWFARNNPAIYPNVTRDVANFAIIPIGLDGKITVHADPNAVGSNADVILDVIGYFEGGDANIGGTNYYSSLSVPTYIGGSSFGAVDGITQDLYIWNTFPGATAVALHICMFNLSGGGYISLFPNDVAFPQISTVNTNGIGQDNCNFTFVKVSGSGFIRIQNGGNSSKSYYLHAVGYTQSRTAFAGAQIDTWNNPRGQRNWEFSPPTGNLELISMINSGGRYIEVRGYNMRYTTTEINKINNDDNLWIVTHAFKNNKCGTNGPEEDISPLEGQSSFVYSTLPSARFEKVEGDGACGSGSANEVYIRFNRQGLTAGIPYEALTFYRDPSWNGNTGYNGQLTIDHYRQPSVFLGATTKEFMKKGFFCSGANPPVANYMC